MADGQELRVLIKLFEKETEVLENLLEGAEKSREVFVRYASLKNKYDKIVAANEFVTESLIKNGCSDSDLEKALDKIFKVELIYLRIKDKVELLDIEKSSVNVSSIQGSLLRLPKVEIKKFDGEVKNWIAFWSQFSHIHMDPSLSEEEKFFYLNQSMEKGSAAEKLLLGFPPSKENYGKALECLRTRYGKDELLIEYYVRQLLDLFLHRGKTTLSSTYDKLDTQLRALESLGVTSEKYAAILFPLVESVVPFEIFKVWERHRLSKNASIKEPSDCLIELMSFLKIEVEGEERLKLRQANFSRRDTKTVPENSNVPIPSTAAALVSNTPTSNSCIFCDKSSHNSQDCMSVVDKSLEDRKALVRKNNACLRCLKRFHVAAKCKSFVRCVQCKGRHFPILCDSAKVSLKNTLTTATSLNLGQVTYLQTLIVHLEIGNEKKRVRVLCDSGSQRSYITKDLAKACGLKCFGKINISQEVFGGKKTINETHSRYKILISNIREPDHRIEVNVIDQNCICNHVPRIQDIILNEQLKAKNIFLSDFTEAYPSESNSDEIDILLGADVWAKIVSSEYEQLTPDLLVIKTRLGWTLLGTSGQKTKFSTRQLTTLLCNNSLENFWSLELMGISDPGVKKSREKKAEEVQTFFDNTVTRNIEGRYTVSLPWIENCPKLDSLKDVSLRRLEITTRKLKEVQKYKEYDDIIKNWINEGIVEVVSDEKCHESHYLPHRAVFKENSTTKIRPVFDASNRDRSGRSLNSILESGPNLIELIPVILTTFRGHAVAVSADIEKAFLQIEVTPGDRDKLRFLWWEDSKVITLRHCRVVFGVTSSPFLLNAVIQHLLKHAPPHLEDVASKLKKSFYVDNCLSGTDTPEELEHFIRDAAALLKLGGFNLRGWVSNINSDTTENILGVNWYCKHDQIGCNITLPTLIPEKLTKRTLLSLTQRLFDPLGFTAPTTLAPKILLQKTWDLDLTWDEVLPEHLSRDFKVWLLQISLLSECRIPRRLYFNGSTTLHVFCDASSVAYGCCIFLRTLVEEETKLSFVLAKARVAPTKKLTLPRLELMAALLGVRLTSLAVQGLDIDRSKIFYWSDSSVTLSWILNQGPWSVFVENRVKEIRDNCNILQWRHVPGVNNPADLLSRGCLPLSLLESKWWEGPKWLLKPEENWPNSTPDPERLEIDKEKRKTGITALAVKRENNIFTSLSERCSSYFKIVRTIIIIIKAICKFSPKFNHYYQTTFDRDVLSSPTEMFLNSEMVLFHSIQKEYFSTDKGKASLKSLSVFEDERGILRLKSRLLENTDSNEFVKPIILPSKHDLVHKMIYHMHVVHNHAGTLSLLMILRENLWIIHGRRTVASVVKKCVVCRKNDAKALQVPIPPLPKDRTRLSATFEITGLDLAGPLYLKSGAKCWIVLFTCAVYRAVHLELVRSLSSAALLQAFKKFICRRGRPKVLYSDNGTNLVGIKNALDNLDWSILEKECCLQKIKWKLNPPTAAWWGGYWERLIGMLKSILKKNLGKASVDHEELSTLLCECESLMNNRPLTYVSEDSEEIIPLRPSNFLISLTGDDVTDFDNLSSLCLKKRWQYLNSVRNGLRQRFRNEYLGFLRNAKSKHLNVIKEGAIVLVGSDDKKRISWPLGRVVELIPGRDTVVRLAKVKTKSGIIMRPLQRLYPLEVDTEEDLAHCNSGEEISSRQIFPGDQSLESEEEDFVGWPDSEVTTQQNKLADWQAKATHSLAEDDCP